MPGAGTHTTIIQHLADLAQNGPDPDVKMFLTDPNLNADWAKYGSPEALQARYAVLGSMGPDIFYLMLDYGASQQDFEDLLIKLAGTFSSVSKLASELNNLVNSTLDTFTDGVWSDIQATFTFLQGIMVNAIVDEAVDQNNFWFFFLPLHQVDDYRENWYWADFLHYVKTGCFTQRLLDKCREYQAADPDSPATRCLAAYTLGYLSHYIADTIGHAYVNRIVETPWRNAWQRHHLVENFIDASVWASWHNRGNDPQGPSTEERTLDSIQGKSADPLRDGAASLHYARLNDLSNIGSAGPDTTLDGIIGNISDLIQQELFDFKLSPVQKLQAPDDPIFLTWTQFMADAMWETYSSTSDHPSRMGRFPQADDIAGAYGAYRLLLSLATEDNVEKPQCPDIVGDFAKIIKQMIADIKKDVGSIPPPPSEGGGSFSLDGLAKAIKDYLAWLGQVAVAAVKVVGDLFAGIFKTGVQAGVEPIKIGLYVINTILYSIYHRLRMVLVMSAYSVPFNEDLMGKWGPLDLTELWNASYDGGPQRYPLEPIVSERDFGSDQTHPHSPYRPYFPPSLLAPVNVELPATNFHPEILKWSTPDDVLFNGSPAIDDMFSAAGPAPAVKAQLNNPDNSRLTDLETFDGSQRYFGTIFENCSRAFAFAIPYILGAPYPEGTILPDYNLDSDRGFAWPCWDVDYINLSLTIMPDVRRLPYVWLDQRQWPTTQLYGVTRLLEHVEAGLRLLFESLHAHGALIIAAAGNDSVPSRQQNAAPRPPRAPARYDSVLSVSSVNSQGQASMFANAANIAPSDTGVVTLGGDGYGVVDGNTFPDAVRGLYISSTFPNGDHNDIGWADWCGTSFSSAIVSGVGAHLMAQGWSAANSMIRLAARGDGRGEPLFGAEPEIPSLLGNMIRVQQRFGL